MKVYRYSCIIRARYVKLIFEMEVNIMNFKISAFGDEISPSLEAQLIALKKLSIDYIELRSVDYVQLIEYCDNKIDEFKRQLDFYNVKVSSIASPIGKIYITGDLKTNFEKFKRTVEIAERLDSPYIRLFSFYIDKDDAPEYFKDKVIEELNRYVEYVKGYKPILLHENEKHIFGDTLARCQYIFKQIESDKLKAVFDPANFVQCNEKDVYGAYQKLKPHIKYLHVKDAFYFGGNVVPAGEGEGMLKDIIEDMKKSEFRGFVSLEPHLNNSLPGAGESSFETAYNYLNNIIEWKVRR